MTDEINDITVRNFPIRKEFIVRLVDRWLENRAHVCLIGDRGIYYAKYYGGSWGRGVAAGYINKINVKGWKI